MFSNCGLTGSSIGFRLFKWTYPEQSTSGPGRLFLHTTVSPSVFYLSTFYPSSILECRFPRSTGLIHHVLDTTTDSSDRGCQFIYEREKVIGRTFEFFVLVFL
uniref:Uncharacterized protein n=1 Tax=Cacopsylla melanoneura TaxID=428564 RepID=A0A8D8Z2R2_9HEMI